MSTSEQLPASPNAADWAVGLRGSDAVAPGVLSPAQLARMANEIFNELPDEQQHLAATAARAVLPPNSTFTGNPYAAVPAPTAPAAPGVLASVAETQSGSYIATPERSIAPDARSSDFGSSNRSGRRPCAHGCAGVFFFAGCATDFCCARCRARQLQIFPRRRAGKLRPMKMDSHRFLLRCPLSFSRRKQFSRPRRPFPALLALSIPRLFLLFLSSKMRGHCSRLRFPVRYRRIFPKRTQ